MLFLLHSKYVRYDTPVSQHSYRYNDSCINNCFIVCAITFTKMGLEPTTSSFTLLFFNYSAKKSIM